MGAFGKKAVFEAMVMDEMVEKISEQEDERIQIRIGLLGKPTFLRWAKKEKAAWETDEYSSRGIRIV